MNRSWQKLGSLYLRCWAFVQLCWVDWNLQTFATEALQKTPISHLESLSSVQKREIQRRVAIIAGTAAYHPCRPRCLHRSLVLYRWLEKQGITATLAIAWTGEIAHAWVSFGDQILNDTPEVDSLSLLHKIR